MLAQLVEQSLSMPAVGSLTPVIGKIYIEHLFVYLFIINCIEKTKINKKRPGAAHFLKTIRGLLGIKLLERIRCLEITYLVLPIK